MGRVLRVEHDAVLAVVQIRRVLQIPRAVVQRQRNHAVVLARGEADAARVAGVFHAQHALGIARLPGAALGGDVPGILLRLGQIDGDLQPAAGRVLKKADVLRHAIHADVVDAAAQRVEILGGRSGAPGAIELLKARAHLGGRGRERAHQLGGEQIPALAAVLDEAALTGDGTQRLQIARGGFGNRLGDVFNFLGRVHAHNFQQTIQRIGSVDGRNQISGDGKIHQSQHQLGGRGHVRNTSSSQIYSILYYPAKRAECRTGVRRFCAKKPTRRSAGRRKIR